jgi:hypothetical protein
MEALRVGRCWGSHICRHSAHRWLTALRAGRFLPTGRLLVLIFVRGWVDPRAIVRLEGLGKLKKKSTSSGTRTGDIPASSIVPQPTTLPHAPIIIIIIIIIIMMMIIIKIIYTLNRLNPRLQLCLTISFNIMSLLARMYKFSTVFVSW